LANRQADLSQIVETLRSPRGFARHLHGREQQGYQHADNGDNDEQLDQGKRAWVPILHSAILAADRRPGEGYERIRLELRYTKNAAAREEMTMPSKVPAPPMERMPV
jgi:hypothetical protein